MVVKVLTRTLKKGYRYTEEMKSKKKEMIKEEKETEIGGLFYFQPSPSFK